MKPWERDRFILRLIFGLFVWGVAMMFAFAIGQKYAAKQDQNREQLELKTTIDDGEIIIVAPHQETCYKGIKYKKIILVQDIGECKGEK